MAGAQQVIATPTIQQETTLTLRGEGRIEMKPDFAMIDVGVSIERTTAGEAMQEQAKKMSAIVPALRSAGIAERDIQTSRLSLNTAYSYQTNQAPTLRSYTASNVVSVKVGDLAKIGQTLDVLVSAGSNSINGISFGVENDEQLRKQARTDAVKQAMSKAQDYASALGLKIKRVVNLSEPGTNAVPAYTRVAVGESPPQGVSVTTIEAGQISIVQLVDVPIELTK